MKFFTKRMAVLLLAAALVLGLCPVFASAETAATEISSLDEITDLAGSYILTADTAVTAPIAGIFTGTFDGGGYTITVNITAAADYTGIFAQIGEGGTVKNFVINNSAVASTGSYTGLVAGACAGTIADVIVENSTVEGYRYTGGLTGKLEATGSITACAVESGSVSKATEDGSDYGTGGLVGDNAGAITGCSNGAVITAAAGSTNRGYYGGIAGKNTGTVTDCYNTGTIENTTYKMYRAGGVIGQNEGAAENCHNIGTVGTNAGAKGGIDAVPSWGYKGTVTNSYYLDTCGATAGGTAKNAEEFETLAATLGENWVDGDADYPVLSWQTWKYTTSTEPDPGTGEATYTVEYYTETLTEGEYELADSKTFNADADSEVNADAAELAGFTFDENNENNVTTGTVTADGALTLALYYTRNSYTLTWDVGEGTITSAEEDYTHGEVKFGAAIVTPEAELEGHTVTWAPVLDTMPADDTTITATWTAIAYDVHWDANGGTVDPELWTGSEVGDVTAGAVYGWAFNKYQSKWGVFTRQLPEPEHDTMVFDGWWTAPEGGEKLNSSDIVTVPENGSFTFYAHWLESYTVTLDPGEGKLSEDTFLVAKGETFGSAVSSIPVASQYAYHHFKEWVNGDEVLTLDTVIDEDKTYYATWNPNYAIVKFYANGGEGTMEDQTITYGNDQPLTKNTFTREGYTFLGWNTSSTATEALYADEAMGVTDPTYNARTYRLYAIWAESAELFDLYGANMKLGNDLSMNFYIEASDITGEGWYAEIVRGDDVTTVALDADAMDSENYYKVTYPGFAAKEMTEEVVVTVYDADGNAVSNPWTDSIRTYAMRILEREDAQAADKTLMVDMLNYGAAAQEKFTYKTEDLANSLLTDEQKAYATETVELADERVQGENYYGSSLNLKTNIQMNVYFTNVSEDMSAVITYTNHNGEVKEVTADVVMSGDYGKVTVEQMVVSDAECLITVEVKDAEGNVIASVTDSVASYCCRTMAEQPLNEYLMKFCRSAWQSFHSN